MVVATGLVTTLAGSRSARADGLPILAVAGGVSSSKTVPGTLQLQAGWTHISDWNHNRLTDVFLGGDLSLRLGKDGPRLAPLLRASLGDFASEGTGLAIEAGPSLRLGSELRPGGMVQLLGGFYGLQASVWAEQAGSQRAVGVTAGVDVIHLTRAALLLMYTPGK